MQRVSFGQLRIVVAEDNPYMRRIVGAILGGFGCRDVHSVGDGASALRLVLDEDPDLLIANINMPAMDGLALTRMIRDPSLCQNPYQPIILLTAHSEPKYLLAARDAGADDFVHKPVQPAVLYRTIRSVLENPRGFVRTKTYFGPDRRRNEARQPNRLRPPRSVQIGDRVVQDFSGDDPPLKRRTKSADAPDAA
jgi:two-component system, chemotaxis family, chemotaxis protein CheY